MFLPQSLALTPARETVVVVVSGTEILVDGRRIAAVADVIDTTDDLIAPLKAELDLQSSRQPVVAGTPAPSKRLTIMGDKDIPYRLLRKVMYTGARANFSDVSFAVRQRFES